MSNESVNFKALLDTMDKAQKEAEKTRPVIVGGRFTHTALAQFLTAWRLKWSQMPYRIWEHVSEIGFHHEPKDQDYLLRGEVFGMGGHLSLRRDGNSWLWHFIGPTGTLVGADWEAQPFWNEKREREVKLRRYTETTLLWGKAIVDKQQNKIGVWWEDRVGAARLKYPESLKQHERVYLHYWRYTEGSQTAFVWYRELSGQAVSND